MKRFPKVIHLEDITVLHEVFKLSNGPHVESYVIRVFQTSKIGSWKTRQAKSNWNSRLLNFLPLDLGISLFT